MCTEGPDVFAHLQPTFPDLPPARAGWCGEEKFSSSPSRFINWSSDQINIGMIKGREKPHSTLCLQGSGKTRRCPARVRQPEAQAAS